jgi:hypothetical protein
MTEVVLLVDIPAYIKPGYMSIVWKVRLYQYLGEYYDSVIKVQFRNQRKI